MIDFRKIETSDFDAILELLDNSFPVNRERIEKDLKEIQKNPKSEGEIHGLWIDHKLVGTATYGACYHKDDGWNGEGFIRYLAIHPDHRRKGHATRIIKKAIAYLKEVGSPCVAVSVLAEDKVVVKIWEDFGFEKYGDISTDEYGTHQSYALWF